MRPASPLPGGGCSGPDGFRYGRSPAVRVVGVTRRVLAAVERLPGGLGAVLVGLRPPGAAARARRRRSRS